MRDSCGTGGQVRHLYGNVQMWLTVCPAESEHLERKSTTFKSNKEYENIYYKLAEAAFFFRFCSTTF